MPYMPIRIVTRGVRIRILYDLSSYLHSRNESATGGTKLFRPWNYALTSGVLSLLSCHGRYKIVPSWNKIVPENLEKIFVPDGHVH